MHARVTGSRPRGPGRICAVSTLLLCTGEARQQLCSRKAAQVPAVNAHRKINGALQAWQMWQDGRAAGAAGRAGQGREASRHACEKGAEVCVTCLCGTGPLRTTAGLLATAGNTWCSPRLRAQSLGTPTAAVAAGAAAAAAHQQQQLSDQVCQDDCQGCRDAAALTNTSFR